MEEGLTSSNLNAQLGCFPLVPLMVSVRFREEFTAVMSSRMWLTKKGPRNVAAGPSQLPAVSCVPVEAPFLNSSRAVPWPSLSARLKRSRSSSAGPRWLGKGCPASPALRPDPKCDATQLPEHCRAASSSVLSPTHDVMLHCWGEEIERGQLLGGLAWYSQKHPRRL